MIAYYCDAAGHMLEQMHTAQTCRCVQHHKLLSAWQDTTRTSICNMATLLSAETRSKSHQLQTEYNTTDRGADRQLSSLAFSRVLQPPSFEGCTRHAPGRSRSRSTASSLHTHKHSHTSHVISIAADACSLLKMQTLTSAYKGETYNLYFANIFCSHWIPFWALKTVGPHLRVTNWWPAKYIMHLSTTVRVEQSRPEWLLRPWPRYLQMCVTGVALF